MPDLHTLRARGLTQSEYRELGMAYVNGNRNELRDWLTSLPKGDYIFAMRQINGYLDEQDILALAKVTSRDLYFLLVDLLCNADNG